MARLAWFTPLPPVRSGISAYSAELLPHLAVRHSIDVFVDERVDSRQREALETAPLRIASAFDFAWRHARSPYDLIVYQLGNAACHDYMWPYLARHAGLTVLHDGQLHHARARRLLDGGRADHYRAEFAFNHRNTAPAVADYVVAGFSGAAYYFWPMTRAVHRASRLVAVHNPWLAASLTSECPEVPVEVIRMGVADPVAHPSDDNDRKVVRQRHGIREDAILFAAFGLVTPEKRVPQAIAALAALASELPHARLLLVGDTVRHYDAMAEARALGVADRVTVTGYVADDALSGYLGAADVCLCLRWPSSRETSASWLRALAAGRTTILTDLVHLGDVPALDPRDWSVIHAASEPNAWPPRLDPVAVAIDILDEDHSLRLAMSRLASDPRLQQRIGRAARAYWSAHHRVEHMVTDYTRIIDLALTTPLVERDVPTHLREDGTRTARELLEPFGVKCDFLSLPWGSKPHPG